MMSSIAVADLATFPLEDLAPQLLELQEGEAESTSQPAECHAV